MRIGVGDRIVVEYWRVDHRLDADSDFFRREGKEGKEKRREGKGRERERKRSFSTFLSARDGFVSIKGEGIMTDAMAKRYTSTALDPLAICLFRPFSPDQWRKGRQNR